MDSDLVPVISPAPIPLWVFAPRLPLRWYPPSGGSSRQRLGDYVASPLSQLVSLVNSRALQDSHLFSLVINDDDEPWLLFGQCHRANR
jgi:hypothetical protein